MMQEYVKEADLKKVEAEYPGARKVTVDADKRVAYVFSGRSLRATTVDGAEYDALVKVLTKSPAKSPVKGENEGEKENEK